MLVLLLGAALAAAPATYKPDDVAAKSVLFTQAAQHAGPAFDQAQRALGALSQGLEELELGVLMLGDRADPADVAWARAARKQATGQFLQVQAQVNLLQDDYAHTFQGALDRALAQETRQVVVCQRSPVQAMMGQGDCPGEDVSAALAARLDADPELAAAVAEMSALSWPTVAIEPHQGQVAPLTGEARWISMGRLARQVAAGTIERRQDDLDRVVADLDLSEDMPKAQAARDAYSRALAEDGAVLIEALTAALSRLEKKADGPVQVGLCAVPTALGGCAGDDVTDDVLALLGQDRRFDKATQALR